MLPSASRSGSVSGASPIGNHSGSARLSSVVVVSPATTGMGAASSTSVLAPGHADSTARSTSTSPGGMTLGTHNEKAMRSGSATISHDRCPRRTVTDKLVARVVTRFPFPLTESVVQTVLQR